jgi:hypothetical protein
MNTKRKEDSLSQTRKARQEIPFHPPLTKKERGGFEDLGGFAPWRDKFSRRFSVCHL